MKKNVDTSLATNIKFSNIPTPLEIDKILNFAKRYPSGDNCQPFSLVQISINEFEVKYFESRGKHYFNTDNIPSMLTLGFLIESLSLGASQNNCIILYSEDVDFNTQGSNWLKFSIIKNDSIKNILSDYINIRHTNRNIYSNQFTELEKMILNSSLKASIQSSELDFKISHINRDLINYFQKCEEVFWSQKQIVSDLSKMISTNLLKNPNVGFYWKTLGISYFETVLIKLLSKIPLITVGLSFMFNYINKMKLKKLIKNSGGLLFFTAPRGVKLNHLENGRSVFRAWLQLTALDLECQPLSIATLLPYYLNTSNDTKGIDTNWIQEVKAMNSQLKESLNISASHEIFWAFRFGRKLKNMEVTFSNREESLFLIKKPHG